ncbi:hypothetical protein EJ076_12145 [Mesorhizobium sp. M7D.F.Ca.US.005.01.1.1]|nr:hypothetical protein EJ076_12145 [Mesorhizobium sp. M7D.F.Ca.US.005.01.1.1]
MRPRSGSRVGKLLKADDELVAVEIAGLAWLENTPAFEAIAIDEKGGPLRLVVPDPRIFAAHKFWVSKRADREPIKRRRDLAQAQAVAGLTTQYLKHLPYEASELRALPGPFSTTPIICSHDSRRHRSALVCDCRFSLAPRTRVHRSSCTSRLDGVSSTPSMSRRSVERARAVFAFKG